eukprot:scaffold16865_cov229-Ochromonas_danica.AAC.2
MFHDIIFRGNNQQEITESLSTILLLGGKRCGKTSLAFRLAYEECCTTGGSPLFITHPNRLDTLPHEVWQVDSNPKTMVRDYKPEVLSKIRMKYISHPSSLRQLILGIHAFASPVPSMIVIDNLSFLLDSSTSFNKMDARFIDHYLQLCSLLKDSLDYLNSDLSLFPGSSAMKVIVTDEINTLTCIQGLQRVFQRIITFEQSLHGGFRLVALTSFNDEDAAGDYNQRSTLSNLSNEILFQKVEFIDAQIQLTR